MIVDTHVHVVSDDRITYPQKADAPQWPSTPSEALLAMMDKASVSRALLVQTYFTYGYDNSYAAESASSCPSRFRAVCVLDPLSKQAPIQLTQLVSHQLVRGIRLMNDRQKNVVSIDDPATFPLWECISTLGIPVCIAALIEDIARVAVVAAQFPRVPIALDHIWGLNVGDGPAFALIHPVLELARFPNVYLKIAPNNSHAVRQSKAKPQDFYQRLVDHFGAGRIMWGSNYPAHPQAYGSLEQRVELAKKDLAFLKTNDQASILGATALSLWPELKP
jgi:L-fuconolactonase